MSDTGTLQDHLQERCRYWQKRLRLQDWDVQVLVKRHSQMTEGRAGEIGWNRSHRWAEISVLDPADLPNEFEFERNLDPEGTLIHELLHIHLAEFSGHEKDTPQYLAIEQAVVAISAALLAFAKDEEGQG